MEPLTGYERVYNILHGKPFDQVPARDGFWEDTVRHWKETGQIPEDWDGVAVGRDLEFDLWGAWPLDCTADIDFETEVLEETEETVLTKNGNGAILRRHKHHASTPEHVDFMVKDRRGWEEHVKPHLLKVDERRLAADHYATVRKASAEQQLFFNYQGVLPFEQMHPVCGHEYMLMGMALDPEWIADMAMTYAKFSLMHMDALFQAHGKPDGFFFFEDMGFKGKPFMSPEMYMQLVQPAHKHVFDWAHDQGLPVTVHSCGYIEPLVPGLVEAGMNCLQAMEVKAGMDLRTLAPRFGDRIAFYGNMDIREIATNDRDRIRAELEAKLPLALKQSRGYILASDHSIPPDVDYETLKWFFNTGRQMSREILGTD